MTASPITLLLTGDVMTGRGIDQVLGTPSDPILHESVVRDARDYVRLAEAANGPVGRGVPDAVPWGPLPALLQHLTPDLVIANLETSLTTSDAAWPGKGIHYRMHPRNVGCLRAAGIAVYTLANNHVLDWGRAGLDETLRTLRGAGLAHAGAGGSAAAAWAPHFAATPHGKVAVLAAACASSGVPASWAAAAERSGVALLPDLSEASARALAQRMAHAEPVRCRVVSLHWGGNWVERVPDEHRAFAHRLIDLGAADVVHGHSSHHALPVEVYRGRPIVYGCGDLLNDYEGIAPHGSRRSDAVALAVVDLDPADGRVQSLEVLPLQIRRFRLGATDAAARAELLMRLNRETGRLGAHVLVSTDGRWWLHEIVR